VGFSDSTNRGFDTNCTTTTTTTYSGNEYAASTTTISISSLWF
jgi:hypothetical protein